ncbi:MAG: nucleotide pyrophosphohydrolase [Candidatus Hydrogenedentes bacterium]|nr:nucleotide pyrophosphohydrolase [Candidatus Hydrogenedentota bacterium]
MEGSAANPAVTRPFANRSETPRVTGKEPASVKERHERHSRALEESWRIQEDAARLGFDWPDISGVIAKVREETQEIEDALAADDPEHAARELGDLLFAAVNLGRFLHTHPVEALQEANRRFTERFAMLRSVVEKSGRKIETCALDELNEVWDRVKVLALQHPNQRG